MKITINDHRKIFAIQKDFTAQFPHFKLEFFAKPHKIGGASSDKLINNESCTLGECRTVHTTGTITIIPQMTVTDLKQNFSDVYGLSVQVFRKSGKPWLETPVIDSLTLEDQNRQSEADDKPDQE